LSVIVEDRDAEIKPKRRRRRAKRSVIEDDYDVLNYAKRIHIELKKREPLFQGLYSEIQKVGEGFYITEDLKICVASIKHLAQHGIKNAEFPPVYRGGVLHENGHGILFPFMTRIKLLYAIVKKYCDTRKPPVKFNPGLFNSIENYVSDIFNELVLYTHNITYGKDLPRLRYLYIYRPNIIEIEERLRNRKALEKKPIEALFTVHNIVFAKIATGELDRPVVKKPKYLSEYLYNMLSEIAEEFDIDRHIEYMMLGGFSSTMAILINNYNLFDTTDYVYEFIHKHSIDGGIVTPHEMARLKQRLTTGDKTSTNYFAYLAILMALYRIHSVNPVSPKLKNVDTGEKRPEPPDDTTLGQIFNQLTGRVAGFLSPELAEKAAKNLLEITLLTRGYEIEETYSMAKTKIPWYRRPTGKLDPMSLIKPSWLDWKVVVPYAMPDYRKTSKSALGVPKKITLIIDESGSTSAESPVLAPIIGLDVSVYDVERVTLMSLLLNVMRYRNDIDTTLVRFSTEVVPVQGTIDEIYNKLKENVNPMMGATNIEEAVRIAEENHEDGPTNYFLLATDMMITRSQAEMIRDIIVNRIVKSPVLILAVNAELPKILLDLNNYENVAVVSVSSLHDYRKLEDAVRKLVNILR